MMIVNRQRKNEFSIYKKSYAFILLAEILILILLLLIEYVKVIAILNLVLGIVILLYNYAKTQKVFSPINIFCFIWIVLMAITSFEYPLMRAMNTWEWRQCLIFVICFSIGGICVSSTKEKSYKFISNSTPNKKSEIHLKKIEYYIYLFLIIFSIGIHLYQVYKYGGFALFSDDPSNERYVYSIQGLGSLSTLGSLGIFSIFCDKKYRRKIIYIILSGVYLILLLLVGIRFQIFLTALLCISQTSKLQMRRKSLWAIIVLGILLYFIFSYVASIRSSLEHANKYYIQTGVYSGTASEIVETEIFRYFGYGQRLMEYYWDKYQPGESCLGYTLYPIMHTLQIDISLPERIWERGYVATSAIVYLYLDFGSLWPIIVIFFSIIINFSYYQFLKNQNDILSNYFWAICAFCLTLSFYSYVHSYVYAVLYFPIIILIVNKIKRFF